jgi:hypothetical protein
MHNTLQLIILELVFEFGSGFWNGGLVTCCDLCNSTIYWGNIRMIFETSHYAKVVFSNIKQSLCTIVYSLEAMSTSATARNSRENVMIT